MFAFKVLKFAFVSRLHRRSLWSGVAKRLVPVAGGENDFLRRGMAKSNRESDITGELVVEILLFCMLDGVAGVELRLVVKEVVMLPGLC